MVLFYLKECVEVHNESIHRVSSIVRYDLVIPQDFDRNEYWIFSYHFLDIPSIEPNNSERVFLL